MLFNLSLVVVPSFVFSLPSIPLWQSFEICLPPSPRAPFIPPLTPVRCLTLTRPPSHYPIPLCPTRRYQNGQPPRPLFSLPCPLKNLSTRLLLPSAPHPPICHHHLPLLHRQKPVVQSRTRSKNRLLHRLPLSNPTRKPPLPTTPRDLATTRHCLARRCLAPNR